MIFAPSHHTSGNSTFHSTNFSSACYSHMEGDDADDDDETYLSVIGYDAPSVEADSARAADVRKYYTNQPLHAASLQSAVRAC